MGFCRTAKGIALTLVLGMVACSGASANEISMAEISAMAAGESEAHTLPCPWSDCRGCTQYRKMCGGVERNFSALEEAEIIAAVREDGQTAAEVDESDASDGQEDATEVETGGQDSPGADSSGDNGNETDESADNGNETDESAEIGNETDESGEVDSDPQQSAQESGESAPRNNHEPAAGAHNLESIPVLGWPGLALMTALLLIAGLGSRRWQRRGTG